MTKTWFIEASSNKSMSKRRAKIEDFHYHKDKEYEPKTFIAITFLGSYTKTPPEHDGYASKLFTFRTDAFFTDTTKEELSKEIGKFLAEKLQNEVFPNYKIGLLHGKLKNDEKDDDNDDDNDAWYYYWKKLVKKPNKKIYELKRANKIDESILKHNHTK